MPGLKRRAPARQERDLPWSPRKSANWRSARPIAAKEINTLIETSSSQVATGVTLVNQTGEALRSIGEQVKTINGIIGTIVDTARDQANDISEINGAVVTMDQGTQQNAALVSEADQFDPPSCDQCRWPSGKARRVQRQ